MLNTFNREGEYMPPVAAAAQAKTKEFSLILLAIVVFLSMAFIIWAKSTKLDLIAKGQGKIVPLRQVQQISHYEGGILKSLHVKSGDMVQKGAVLAIVHNTKAKAQYEKMQSQFFALQANKIKLEGQISCLDKLKFPAKLKKQAPVAVMDAERDFKSWKNKIKNEEAIARKKLAQRKAELEGQITSLKELRIQQKLLEDEIKRSKKYVGTVVSKSDFSNMKVDLAKTKVQVATTFSKVKTLRAVVSEFKEQVSQIKIKHKAEALKELKHTKVHLAEAKQGYVTGGDEVSRTEIIAPTKGIIKEILVNTLGDTLSPGEVIFELVPVGDVLLFEAEVQPKDIGFLKINNQAMVKMGAFDFSIYGGLKGKVIKISPDSFTDKSGKTYFKVIISTDKTYILDKNNNKKMYLSVGMMGEVDIKIGTRSVFDSLIKPLTRGLKSALREK